MNIKSKMALTDFRALRCCFGVAPAAKRSGQAVVVQRRLAAYWQVMTAVQRDEISRANCRALRSRGRKHGRALRTVADRLLGVVCGMLETRQILDPERRSKNGA